VLYIRLQYGLQSLNLNFHGCIDFGQFSGRNRLRVERWWQPSFLQIKINGFISIISICSRLQNVVPHSKACCRNQVCNFHVKAAFLVRYCSKSQAALFVISVCNLLISNFVCLWLAQVSCARLLEINFQFQCGVVDSRQKDWCDAMAKQFKLSNCLQQSSNWFKMKNILDLDSRGKRS
jgi:hypothetical protein